MAIENLGFIRQYPYSHKENLSFGDENVETMIDEVREYKRFGGGTLVEVTTCGIQPDYEFLKKVSLATQLNVVCSTGYYLAHTLDESTKGMTVDQLTQSMIKDLTVGRDGIKAGCIGEIGCMYPLLPEERKALEAAAKAQIKHGGHGYGHILENVVPKMLARGISQADVDKILIHNPKTWLTMKRDGSR